MLAYREMVSRRAPPSSVCTGRPSALPWRSHWAMSTALIASIVTPPRPIHSVPWYILSQSRSVCRGFSPMSMPASPCDRAHDTGASTSALTTSGEASASPRPVIPASVCTRTITSSWMPSALVPSRSGRRRGIASTRVIFMPAPWTWGRGCGRPGLGKPPPSACRLLGHGPVPHVPETQAALFQDLRDPIPLSAQLIDGAGDGVVEVDVGLPDPVPGVPVLFERRSVARGELHRHAGVVLDEQADLDVVLHRDVDPPGDQVGELGLVGGVELELLDVLAVLEEGVVEAPTDHTHDLARQVARGMDVLRVPLVHGERGPVPVRRTGEVDDRQPLRVLMDVVGGHVPALRDEPGDHRVELHDVPGHLFDAEQLGDRPEDPDVEPVELLGLRVLVREGVVVRDPDHDPLAEHPLERAVPAGEGTDAPDAPDAGQDRQRCRDEKESGQQRTQPSARPALHAHPSFMVWRSGFSHTVRAPHPPSASPGWTRREPPRGVAHLRVSLEDRLEELPRAHVARGGEDLPRRALFHDRPVGHEDDP